MNKKMKRNMNNNDNESAANGDSHKIDESLYSRQLYVLGHEAMARMARSAVLIIGAGGLGVEIAKNVILGGVKSVTLADTKLTDNYDLSSQVRLSFMLSWLCLLIFLSLRLQFYLGEQSIGLNRAEQSLPQLAELNPYVKVDILTQPIAADMLSGYSVIVITDLPLVEQLGISEIARENNTCLIIATTRGLFGQIFCDFGENFTVVDTNGENPISVLISGITREKSGVVACIEDHRHGLEDGDVVRFSEVKGMTEINGKEFKVKVTGPCQFSIGDTTGFSDYLTGGLVTQVKQPKTINFVSFFCLIVSFQYSPFALPLFRNHLKSLSWRLSLSTQTLPSLIVLCKSTCSSRLWIGIALSLVSFLARGTMKMLQHFMNCFRA